MANEKDEFLTAAQVSKMLGVSTSALGQWRKRGDRGPAWIKRLYKEIVYRRSDVEEFMKEHHIN